MAARRIKRSDINFPVIKIKLVLTNKDVRKIEESKNVKNLLSIISNKRNVSFKYDNGVFNIIAVNVKITKVLIERLLDLLFKTLRRVRNVTGFEYYIIMSKTRVHSFKCMNKKCVVSREKINKFMSFIND